MAFLIGRLSPGCVRLWAERGEPDSHQPQILAEAICENLNGVIMAAEAKLKQGISARPETAPYLTLLYKLYALPLPAPTCGLVLIISSSVSLSMVRVCETPSQFGNVLAVNVIVTVFFSSSTV